MATQIQHPTASKIAAVVALGILVAATAVTVRAVPSSGTYAMWVRVAIVFLAVDVLAGYLAIERHQQRPGPVRPGSDTVPRLFRELAADDDPASAGEAAPAGELRLDDYTDPAPIMTSSIAHRSERTPLAGPQFKAERDAVRAWARASGLRVADRGPLPKALLETYRRRNEADAVLAAEPVD